MRQLSFLLMIVLLTACSGAGQDAEQTVSAARDTQASAPQPQTPPDGYTFVESDIELAWDGQSLEPHQRYVLRLWIDDESPQEIWTEASHVNAQPLIDPFSRDAGRYQWRVAVVNTDDSGAFESMGSAWSDIQTLNRVRRLSPTALPAAQWSDLTQHMVAQNHASTFETVNYLRDFLHRHADISGDSGYQADYSDAMQQLFDHSQGNADAPQLYCNGLSTGMLTTLAQLGIESRLIFLYADPPGWFSEHTFLEVFNPDTQQWEVHDPTFNLYFVDSETGQRVATERLVFGSRETILGCDSAGDCSGEAYMNNVAQYMEVFRYGFSKEIFVNPDRFDITTRVTAFDNKNFPEFLASNPRSLTFRFDAWDVPDFKRNQKNRN